MTKQAMLTVCLSRVDILLENIQKLSRLQKHAARVILGARTQKRTVLNYLNNKARFNFTTKRNK